jgi:hypothetical protein
MMKTMTILRRRPALLALCLTGAYACSSDKDDNYFSADEGVAGQGASPASGTGFGAGDDASGTAGAPGSGTPSTGTGTNGSVVIDGGGVLDSPLGVGCGPETAADCYPVGGACRGAEASDYQFVAAYQQCFYGPDPTLPAASAEYITESYAGQEYVHIRVTFDPAFVDNVYGDCSVETGWDENKPHTFRDLRGSDHVEMLLYECDNDLAMHFALDYIHDDDDAPCGYRSAGVSGGDGEMMVGDEAYVLAASSSLDRNLNGCGYCQTETSPCPGPDYTPTATEPNWDYRMVYEVWISTEAFDSSGFCDVDIDYVHASPSKADDNTITVEPDDCPDTPWYGSGGTTGSGGAPGTGGAGGVPVGGAGGAGPCPDGYVPDVMSEGQYCVPA